MKRLTVMAMLFLMTATVYGQPADKKLQRKIEQLIQGFGGDIGVYVKNLKSGKVVAIHADSVFPTASMVKIPILIGLMDRINNNELQYHQVLTYNDSLLYAGVDILGSFKNDEKIELSKVMMLMLTMSDNTASLWLQSLAGTGTRINTILDSLGFEKTRVNSRTPGREEARARYGWGQTTPREMATLLEWIYKEEVISKGASDRMLRSLNKNYWDDVSVAQLPPYATVYSKNGAVDLSRSEVALVRGVQSNYVFCVATNNNKDESWQPTNEAWQVTRKISSLLWHYFEPKDKWQPAPDAEKFN